MQSSRRYGPDRAHIRQKTRPLFSRKESYPDVYARRCIRIAVGLQQVTLHLVIRQRYFTQEADLE